MKRVTKTRIPLPSVCSFVKKTTPLRNACVGERGSFGVRMETTGSRGVEGGNLSKFALVIRTININQRRGEERVGGVVIQ